MKQAHSGPRLKTGMLFLALFFSAGLLGAEVPLPSDKTSAAPSDLQKEDSPDGSVSLSKPEPIPPPAAGAPSASQKPSQGEGEKAPVPSRPAAVPEFSLPEVVITGENELTIGAKRLDRKENDVTLGSHDLTGVERSLNDLPGLQKTFTALAAEEPGPSRDTALALHLGGGIPGTYGGWGLFGQEFKDFQYLLSGFGSTWGGETTASGHDGDRQYGAGGVLDLWPSGPQKLVLNANFKRLDAELPYQGSIREIHDGWDLGASYQWALSNLAQAQVSVTNQWTSLDSWDGGLQDRWARESEGRFKITADNVGPVFNRFSIEAGGRNAGSDFQGPSTGYDWGWILMQGLLKKGENLSLAAKLQAQAGDGADLPLALYPGLDLTWRVFGDTQLNLYWRSDRYVESFYSDYMDREHLAPSAGFPSPTEVSDEFGGRFTQKLNESLILSVSASSALMRGYHQWSDLDPLNPLFIQAYSTLGQVQMDKAAANLQWNFGKGWQAAATYQWTQGLNQSGDGRRLTDLPVHRGILSLYREDDHLETRLDLEMASERWADEAGESLLPAYAVVGLDAAYHLSKTLTLWLNGDNLLGTAFQIQPGYLEPRDHIRGGVEMVF
jgi:TonB dependent receptor-like, beta-barrel